MNGKNDNSTAQYRHRSWSDLALNCCFVVFAALFLVVQYGVALASSPSQECEVHNHASPVAHGTFIFSAHHTSHQPFGLEPALVERGILESESENDSDDETGKLSHNLPVAINLNLHSENSLFLQLKHASDSRARISLFVLHHSWKSFLS